MDWANKVVGYSKKSKANSCLLYKRFCVCSMTVCVFFSMFLQISVKPSMSLACFPIFSTNFDRNHHEPIQGRIISMRCFRISPECIRKYTFSKEIHTCIKCIFQVHMYKSSSNYASSLPPKKKPYKAYLFSSNWITENKKKPTSILEPPSQQRANALFTLAHKANAARAHF